MEIMFVGSNRTVTRMDRITKEEAERRMGTG